MTHPSSSCRSRGVGDPLILTHHRQKPHHQLLARNGMFGQYVEAPVLNGMVLWQGILAVMRFACSHEGGAPIWDWYPYKGKGGGTRERRDVFLNGVAVSKLPRLLAMTP